MEAGNSLHQVSTGIDSLDEVIGGFPRGGLIVVSGGPGSGKTIFSSRFLYTGVVTHGERGIYVSFAENKETFYKHMLQFGWDFKGIEEKGMFKFLDMVTVREEGTSTVINRILDNVYSLDAKRLVIDSYTALTQAFREEVDSRILLHTILGKITNQLGCTALLIVETMKRMEGPGRLEEFVADGVITLKRRVIRGRVMRELEIVKMRGQKILHPQYIFTLNEGFRIFKKWVHIPVKERERFKPLPDREGYYSTGIRDLDDLLNGGYPKGATVVITIDSNVPREAYESMISATVCNFANKGRGVVYLPTRGVDATMIREVYKGFVDEEAFGKKFFIMQYARGEKKPYMVMLDGTVKDLEMAIEALEESEKDGDVWLGVVGWDQVEATYDLDVVKRILNEMTILVRRLKYLGLFFAKSDSKMLKELVDLADIHLSIKMVDGSLVLIGEKPFTPICHIDFRGDPSQIEITPII